MLAELTTRSGVTRWRIEKDIFQSATYADLFSTVPEQVLRAIVGLDRDRLRGMIVTYLTTESMTQPDDTLRVATSHLLDGISLAAETEDTRRKFEFAFKEALSERLTQLDPETIAEGFRVILTSPQRGDPDAFPSVIPMLHAAIGKSADPRQLSVLAKVYADARTKIGIPIYKRSTFLRLYAPRSAGPKARRQSSSRSGLRDGGCYFEEPRPAGFRCLSRDTCRDQKW